jgi:hypothetical protein
MRWLKTCRCGRFRLANEELPHDTASLPDDRTARLVAETGEAPPPTAETLDLERSIARRTRAASRDPDAAATSPPFPRESVDRFRRGPTTIFFARLRNLVGRQKSARH